tara:strand:- start:307 stop:945 length:639 start_codon:yes stop_codon:yes gene_type:complete
MLFKIYNDKKNLLPVENHPTKVFTEIDPVSEIVNSRSFRLILPLFFNGNVGYVRGQFFRKNKDNPNKVKLHNDLMYSSGGSEKYSIFLPITNCNKLNGNLILYPGTHHFGLLGDAGELNRDALPKDLLRMENELYPGDILIMNSAIWHESNHFKSGQERIFFEFKLVSSQDPCSVGNLLGDKKQLYKLPSLSNDLFLNSRLQRLTNLYRKTQ